MKVFVVMGNDYPNAVFSTAEAAQAYCHRMAQKDKEDAHKSGRPSYAPRTYWRDYEFEVDAKK